MRFNKKEQYGLLFVLYLCRSGRATIDNAALNLNVPKSFLEQIARQLRLANIVNSVRGFHGGHELACDPTVAEVLGALSDAPLVLTEPEFRFYTTGAAEHRALGTLAKNVLTTLNVHLNRKVSNIGKELVANELQALNRASEGRAH